MDDPLRAPGGDAIVMSLLSDRVVTVASAVVAAMVGASREGAGAFAYIDRTGRRVRGTVRAQARVGS